MELKGKKLNVTEMSLEEIKRHPKVHVSPRAGKTNKAMAMAMASAPSGTGVRSNCLCSPTTHAGSFRCRHHRVSGMPRGGSVGSHLSLLHHSKPEHIPDSLQPQSSF